SLSPPLPLPLPPGVWRGGEQERYETERWTLTAELAAELTEARRQNAALRCQRQELEKKQGQTQARLDSSSATVLYLSRQLQARRDQAAQAGFGLARLRAQPRRLRFYTGFESAAKFDGFLRLVTQEAGRIPGAGPGGAGPESGPQPSLSPGDQLLLVLSRLRLGLLLQDLAFRFRVSETTVSR
ncbi:hypothetical protein chiPu_0032906, partial [Chiloscyllium punctatum]|nr:hypothetical protein [Chiloscyllium punctatum]